MIEHHSKGPFRRSVFKDPILVPKTRSRHSDGPISRFRFCCENVGRSFVVCSHDPFFRTDKESSIWRMQNLSAPFIFQGEYRMKIEHVLQFVSWSLAEFRHNKIVQSPHENYFNVCRQPKEK